MKLSDENRTTLLIHLHKSIEEMANTMANHNKYGRTRQLIRYPPNGGFTEEESAPSRIRAIRIDK